MSPVVDAGGCAPPGVTGGDLTVRELQNDISQFAHETFGPDREDAAWKKLFEELGEVIKNPEDPLEWADVFIILLDLATMYGIDVGDASVRKMVINRARKWGKSRTGVMQHIVEVAHVEP